MVKDHIEDNGDPRLMKFFHEHLQLFGGAVRSVHSERKDYVISPVELAGRLMHRHNLDGVDFQFITKPPHQVIPVGRILNRIEAPLFRPEADVHLVDPHILEASIEMFCIPPVETAEIREARPPVYSKILARLISGKRIGEIFNATICIANPVHIIGPRPYIHEAGEVIPEGVAL
ncbi:MAG: hypothetical protein BWY40_01165 [bacterium ADurb.Bin270]|nr:MAG: hypothetical protein BWY40_01165 [bacterium ADurb.Bin270]